MSHACEVCGHGCARAVLAALAESSAPSDDKASELRLLGRAVSATSAPETRRYLARAAKMGASDETLESLSRCEPLESTYDGNRHFHVGCRPEDIGECHCCGVWHASSEDTVAGPGLPCCGAGATPTGKPVPATLDAHQIACLSARLLGKEKRPQLPDRRAEAIELGRILSVAQAELALREKEEPNG